MRKKLPEWLKKKIPCGSVTTEKILERNRLNTVCESAHCPNRGECFSGGEATFMILGSVCTRNCGFCAVRKGVPAPVDEGEPARLSKAVAEMGLRYVVIASVTRDDLPDGGASQFAGTVRELRKDFNGSLGIELLIPDLKGSTEALKIILEQNITVLNHNLETVKRLYPVVRQKADYHRSLELLRSVKKQRPDMFTKSGLMLGLGETKDEALMAMKDLRDVSCDLLTLGQYLRPGPGQVEVAEFIEPERFAEYKRIAESMGFSGVASGPFVRSSYQAGQLLNTCQRVKVSRPTSVGGQASCQRNYKDFY